jgi:hypothetical protein
MSDDIENRAIPAAQARAADASHPSQQAVSAKGSIPIAGHTPGPWQAYASVQKERGYLIDTALLTDSTNGYVIADNVCGHQAAANAALIAAAPDLLEALEWYGEQARLARLIHSEGDAGRQALASDGGRRAQAIIAKATGAP